MEEKEVNNKQQEQELYTKEQVEKMLQSEADKRVSKALETSKAKWQAELEEKLKAEKAEAEQKGKMTEAEKWQHEFEQKEKAFQEEKQQFLKQKLEMHTVKELSAVGLPIEFSQFVTGESEEDIKTGIETLKAVFDTAIEKTVSEKLQGHTPKGATKIQAVNTVTKEEFKKMSYAEKMAIYESNPDLYKELKNE